MAGRDDGGVDRAEPSPPQAEWDDAAQTWLRGQVRIGDLATVGGLLLALVARQGRWIQRRSEEISFEDALTVRRETTLDVSLQRFFWPEGSDLPVRLPTQGSRLLLPISTFDRRNHYDIVVSDACGESLPHLSRLQERRLLAAGMAQISLNEQGRLSGDADYSLELWNRYSRLLELLQMDPGSSAPTRASDSTWLSSVHDYLEQYKSRYLVIATPSHKSVFGDRMNSTEQSELFRIRECHSEPLPSTRKRAFAAERLKGYSQERQSGALVDQWWTTAGRSLSSSENQPLWTEKLFLDDTTIEILTSQLEAQSYHLYVNLPTGTYVERTILAVASEPLKRSQRISLIQISDDDVHWDVAHFGWSRRLLPRSDDVILDSRVLMIIRPIYKGFLRAPTLLSGLTTFTLLVLTATLGWTSARYSGWQHFPLHRSDQSDPVTVLLLGVLTVGLGVIIRDQEHRMTSKAADGFRLRLGLISISTFLTALTVGIGIAGTFFFWILAAMSGFSLIMFLGVLRMALFSRKRRNNKPQPEEPTPRATWWRSLKTFMGVEPRYFNVPEERRLMF